MNRFSTAVLFNRYAQVFVSPNHNEILRSGPPTTHTSLSVSTGCSPSSSSPSPSTAGSTCPKGRTECGFSWASTRLSAWCVCCPNRANSVQTLLRRGRLPDLRSSGSLQRNDPPPPARTASSLSEVLSETQGRRVSAGAESRDVLRGCLSLRKGRILFYANCRQWWSTSSSSATPFSLRTHRLSTSWFPWLLVSFRRATVLPLQRPLDAIGRIPSSALLEAGSRSWTERILPGPRRLPSIAVSDETESEDCLGDAKLEENCLGKINLAGCSYMCEHVAFFMGQETGSTKRLNRFGNHIWVELSRKRGRTTEYDSRCSLL